jgi:hypothetical protein
MVTVVRRHLRVLDAEKTPSSNHAPLCGRWFLGEGVPDAPLFPLLGRWKKFFVAGCILPGDFFYT